MVGFQVLYLLNMMSVTWHKWGKTASLAQSKSTIHLPALLKLTNTFWSLFNLDTMTENDTFCGRLCILLLLGWGSNFSQFISCTDVSISSHQQWGWSLFVIHLRLISQHSNKLLYHPVTLNVSVFSTSAVAAINSMAAQWEITWYRWHLAMNCMIKKPTKNKTCSRNTNIIKLKRGKMSVVF